MDKITALIERLSVSRYEPGHFVFGSSMAPKILGKELPPGLYAVIINKGYRELYSVNCNGDYAQVFESDYPNA